MQTDGGLWLYPDKYIIGTTTVHDGKGNLRSFACYNKWQDCIDQVLLIFNERTEGSNHLEIVPNNPNDSDFFATGYCNHWIHNPNGATTSPVKKVYENAKTIFK